MTYSTMLARYTMSNPLKWVQACLGGLFEQTLPLDSFSLRQSDLKRLDSPLSQGQDAGLEWTWFILVHLDSHCSCKFGKLVTLLEQPGAASIPYCFDQTSRKNSQDRPGSRFCFHWIHRLDMTGLIYNCKMNLLDILDIILEYVGHTI